jgi:hypothetical protein
MMTTTTVANSAVMDHSPKTPVTGSAVDAVSLAPLVAEALRVWDTLRLELGDAALITAPSPWAGLLAEVASWYGAFPIVVSLTQDGGDRGGSEQVQQLRDRLSGFPAVRAVEVSGRADAVDLLLETVPHETAVMFAGPSREPFTIDYYVNVHRKGLFLASTVLSARRARPVDAASAHIAERASRLLASGARLQSLAAAVDPALLNER